MVEETSLLGTIIRRTRQPSYFILIQNQKEIGTEVEQHGDLFRGAAEGGGRKEDVEVCREFEDLGVMCDFKQISSAYKDG